MLLGYGVQFISYTEAHFRTTGPAGELMIAIATWIAQQERIRLSERTKAGLERPASKGVSAAGRGLWLIGTGLLNSMRKAGRPVNAR
jgi:DNA invertase Pin-like site-specific DNA recombinase